MSSPELSETTPDAVVADVVVAPEAEAELEVESGVDAPAERDALVEPEAVVEAPEGEEPEAAEPEVAEPEVAEVVAAEPAPAKPVAAKPVPAKPSAPKPGAPKPGAFRAPSPAVVAAHATHPVKVPIASDVSAEDLAAALEFGSVAGDVVSVKDGDETVEVGPAQGDTPLESYARAYFELKSGVDRFHARLTAAELSPKDIDESLASLTASLAEPKVVGDLAALRAQFATVQAEATAVRDALAEERRKARKEAVEAREVIVARAEAIAAAPTESVHWKNDTEELRSLLDAWKEAQRSGARIPKDAERALWKRFTHARTSFERTRKHHFAEVDGANSAVADRKEALVAKAEALLGSKDFERGAREFRDLMNEWRTAGRGRRSVDDALWKRFQTAQDAFFEAKRNEATAEEEALAPNVSAAETAVKDAEALLPIKDLAASKSGLRAAQDRFEAAGRLPRTELQTLTRRLGAVEKAIRDADSASWSARNPEVEARVSGAAAQLHAAIADLEAKREAAKTPAEKKSIDEALAARKAWLKQIEGAAR